MEFTKEQLSEVLCKRAVEFQTPVRLLREFSGNT